MPPKKSGKGKSAKVMTAKEKSREEEQAKHERSWNGHQLEFVKVLGDGADAVAVAVRFAAAGKKSLVFALREQVLGPGIGGEEFGDEDVARVVRHIKNNRKLAEHAFVVPLVAWTIVERNKEPVLLMAFPLCETSLSKLLREDGGKLPADNMPCQKLWLAKIAMTLGYMHGLKVIHGDLHPGNVLFEKVDGYLEPFVADFGGSVDYSDPDQVGVTGSTLSRESATDVRSLGQLHCAMKHGTSAIKPGTSVLNAKAMEKLKKEDPDEYRMVVTLDAGELPAREIVLMQGPKKARQHPQFAIDLAAKYPDHPLAKVSAAPLMKKFTTGKCGLRLRDAVGEDKVLKVKAHEEGELVPYLSPYGVLCKTKGAGHDCPPGGLWSVGQFVLHQHDGKKVMKELETKRAKLQLVKEEGKEELEKEVFEALLNTHYTGDPSLAYSTDTVICATHKRWADIILTNDHDRLSFRHRCVVSSDCQERFEKCAYPTHLGELVESSRPQAWTDPWTKLFSAARNQRTLEDMPVVQLLREHGIVWQEPTVAAVRKAIDDATPKKPLEEQFEKLGTSADSGSEERQEPATKATPKRSPKKSGGGGKGTSKAGGSKR